MNRLRIQCFSVVVCLIGLWAGITATQAALIQFTVDPDRSSITLSGSALGSAFQEQAAGSLTTKFQGTVLAEVTAASIQFTGGSAVQAANNGSWQPKLDGSDGNEPANYGGTVSTLLGSAKAALRNLLLDAVSGTLPLNSEAFDSSGVTYFFPTNAISTLSYRVSGFIPLAGKEALAGRATNQISQGASLKVVGGTKTLTISLDTVFKFGLLNDNDTTVNLKGQLVATSSAVAPPSIGSISAANQQITLRWQGAPGEKYQVQTTTNLASWTTVASDITSTTSDYSWSTALAPLTHFYRIGK